MATKKKPARKAAPKKRAAVKKAPAKPRLTRDGGPAGWPTLSPYMAVRSGQKSIEFYAAAFGFRTVGEVMRDESGEVQHAGMQLGEACIMFAPRGMSDDMKPPIDGGGNNGLSLYYYVPDVDALAARAERAGAAVLQKPADQFWGDRTAMFKDPDGYHWTFATHIRGFGPDKTPKV